MNRKLLNLTENEKNSILEMHKKATRKHYLTEQEANAEETGTEEAGTEETGTEETTPAAETYDCSKLEEYLQDANVKKWIENMKGPKKWLVQKGTHAYDERAGYEGAKKVIAVIQCKLGMEPDGLFGNDTKSKVEAFQTANNLVKDGRVGKNTINKLFETEAETEAETETETANQNECYMSLGREPIEGQGEAMAGYEVTRVVEGENGEKKYFGFNPDGTGNVNMGAGNQSNPVKWSCDNGELKLWQEVQF